MEGHRLETPMVQQFKAHLFSEERAAATVEKYIRDVTAFCRSLPDGHVVTKEVVVAYKQEIAGRYAASSVNSMLAAVNCLLKYLGWGECCVRQLRIQRRAFREQEKELRREEYLRLLNAAARRHNRRLSLVMQAICATGIRVGELRYITVESLAAGHVEVDCKVKRRTILLPKQLCRMLRQYARERGISAGPVFVTRRGRPLDRCNIWAEMKKLCADAGVSPEKVYPHSLRHLFARTYYNLEKDIARLADILGHSSINTTRIYVSSSGWEHARQLERMRLIL